MTTMRALTIRQPWAWAIIAAGKDVENRSRNIAGDYRGPVAIHAGLTPDTSAPTELWRPATEFEDLTYGAVVGVAHLWAVHHARPGCCPNRGVPPFGSAWAQPDAWHLCLSESRRLADPVPAKGHLGLWTLDADTEAKVRERDVACR